MARTKAKKWEPGDKTPRERARLIGSRIRQAASHAGLSFKDLARLVDRRPEYLDKAECGEIEPFAADLVKIAFTCEVDSRWLATGIPSPAAAAALEMISNESLLRLGSIGTDTTRTIVFARERIFRTPQPMLELGRCRYCLCVWEAACDGGCSWVDGDETICSACLDPERVDAAR